MDITDRQQVLELCDQLAGILTEFEQVVPHEIASDRVWLARASWPYRGRRAYVIHPILWADNGTEADPVAIAKEIRDERASFESRHPLPPVST